MKYRILENSFLGNPPDKDKTYIIIGAGVAGLMTGYFFKKAGISFKIIEKSNRAGGLLQSHQLENGIAEQAANGFLWCRELEEMATDLGLELITPNKEASGRYLVRDKELFKYPLSMSETLSLVGGLFVSHSTPFETIQEFGEKQFGEAVARQMLEPAFAGIYGAHISQLSFPGAMTKVAKVLNSGNRLPLAIIKSRGERSREDSTGKGGKGTHSFENGIEALTIKLTEYLKEEITYNTDGLEFKSTDNNLVITAPAYIAKDFFTGDVYDILNAVQYVSLISSTYIFKKSDFKNFTEGFGCLIPRNEKLPTLGVLFNSCIFPNRVKNEELISLTCMLRDDEDTNYVEMSDEAIKDIHHKDLNELFGLEAQPIEYKVFKWKKAFPLYSPDLHNNWFALSYYLKEKHPTINLFGNYTGELAIRGMAESLGKLFKKKEIEASNDQIAENMPVISNSQDEEE